jgi:hypothetical protein
MAGFLLFLASRDRRLGAVAEDVRVMESRTYPVFGSYDVVSIFSSLTPLIRL